MRERCFDDWDILEKADVEADSSSPLLAMSRFELRLLLLDILLLPEFLRSLKVGVISGVGSPAMVVVACEHLYEILLLLRPFVTFPSSGEDVVEDTQVTDDAKDSEEICRLRVGLFGLGAGSDMLSWVVVADFVGSSAELARSDSAFKPERWLLGAEGGVGSPVVMVVLRLLSDSGVKERGRRLRFAGRARCETWGMF